MFYKIKNPLTGRPILVNGPTFKKLVKDGVINSEGVPIKKKSTKTSSKKSSSKKSSSKKSSSKKSSSKKSSSKKSLTKKTSKKTSKENEKIVGKMFGNGLEVIHPDMKFSAGAIKYLATPKTINISKISPWEIIVLSSEEAALHNRKVISVKDVKVIMK